MRRTVYLARHGETEWNRVGRWQGHTDIALSDAGRAQARALAEVMRVQGLVRVHASDLVRARETAEIVARVIGVAPVHVDPDLRERGFGCFEGLTRAECAARFPDLWARYQADPRNAPPDAEPHDAVIERMRLAVRRAAGPAAVDAGAILVVSHGASIRALVAAVTGTRPPPLGNTALFRMQVSPDGFDGVTQLA